jgi:hypothetical protein
MKKCCFLWGTDWILKYYLDQLRLQRNRFLYLIRQLFPSRTSSTYSATSLSETNFDAVLSRKTNRSDTKWGLRPVCRILLKMAVFWNVAPRSHRPDDGCSKLLWNISQFLPDYTAPVQKTFIFILDALRTSISPGFYWFPSRTRKFKGWPSVPRYANRCPFKEVCIIA